VYSAIIREPIPAPSLTRIVMLGSRVRGAFERRILQPERRLQQCCNGGEVARKGELL